MKLAEKFLEELPDGLSCHDVVGLFHAKYPNFGRPVRGYWFNRGYEHSWIEFDDDQVVLDLYPWAQCRPLLMTVGYGTLRLLYVEEDQPRGDL